MGQRLSNGKIKIKFTEGRKENEGNEESETSKKARADAKRQLGAGTGREILQEERKKAEGFGARKTAPEAQRGVRVGNELRESRMGGARRSHGGIGE